MLTIRRQGLVEYQSAWRAMRAFCDAEDADVAGDEVWLLQHPPIYTLGQAADIKHRLRDNGVPVIRSDRGGQITYHGPGQLLAYCMLNLRRRRWGARFVVEKLQDIVVGLLSEYGIAARLRPGAPGVYVGDAKIAALGLRIRRGRTYHGVSLNVDMDLSPFADINPCGYPGLKPTQIADFLPDRPLPKVEEDFAGRLAEGLR